MNRRGFLGGLLGALVAAVFGWKPKFTPFAWETEPAWSVLGDFSNLVIVDRIGQSVTWIEPLNVAYRPGVSGLVRYWRESGS
jgi:hypothetical protein